MIKKILGNRARQYEKIGDFLDRILTKELEMLGWEDILGLLGEKEEMIEVINNNNINQTEADIPIQENNNEEKSTLKLEEVLNQTEGNLQKNYKQKIKEDRNKKDNIIISLSGKIIKNNP